MKRSLCALTLLALTAVVAAPLFAEENPIQGKWKLNVAKSKFEPGPAPKTEGNGAKYSFEGVAGDGKSYCYGFVSNYDGKDSSVTGAEAPGGADTIALKRVDARKVEGTLKKAGKEIAKVTAEVSKGGKVATVILKGKSADGEEFSTGSVHDKE